MSRRQVLILSFSVGISVTIAGVLIAKRLTRLPVLIILGSALVFVFCFLLLLAFSLPPLVKTKALRNAFVAFALSLPLLALSAFLGAYKQTLIYGLLVLIFAMLVKYTLIWPLMKRNLREFREKTTNQQ